VAHVLKILSLTFIGHYKSTFFASLFLKPFKMSQLRQQKPDMIVLVGVLIMLHVSQSWLGSDFRLNDLKREKCVKQMPLNASPISLYQYYKYYSSVFILQNNEFLVSDEHRGKNEYGAF